MQIPEEGAIKCSNGEVVTHWKQFNDPVHGHIKLYDACLSVLDTPQFQRLRFIKQLGAVHYVYDSANHTRFEHSRGTCYLARKVLNKLAKCDPKLGIDKHDQASVALAGLCHDLGHGPFSHVLDNEIFPAIAPDYKKTHEERGVEVLDYLIDENNLDINSDHVRTAKGFICAGENTEYAHPMREKRYLWDIVANARTGIDVDKFDYLARDSRNCNIPLSFDHRRVINSMRVVDDEICFRDRDAEAAYEIFLSRFKMHKTVYTHHKVKAIEYMIVDAIIAANPVLKLTEKLQDIHSFCKLDDAILSFIKFSDDPALAESKRILRRIETRRTYRFIGEAVIPHDRAGANFQRVTEKDIEAKRRNGATFTSDDIIVQNLKIDYGKGDENPVDKVYFWDKKESKKFPIPREKISNTIPINFRDWTVRVFYKHEDPDMQKDISNAFEMFQTERYGTTLQRTPSVQKKRSLQDPSSPRSINSTKRRIEPIC